MCTPPPLKTHAKVNAEKIKNIGMMTWITCPMGHTRR